MIGLPPCSFSAAVDHRRLGAVDHQRRVHRAGEAADHLVHFADLVAADERGADIERVGAFADLLAAHRDAAVPVVLLLRLAPLLRAVGVAALADGEERVLLPQRHRLVQAGDRRHPHRLARHRRRAGCPPPSARRRSIASSAAMCCVLVPQQPPIRLTPSCSTKRSSQLARSAGAERIVRLAIDQFRQAGIRLHRQQPRPVLRQPADMLGHLLRPGGAVQPHHRHIQRVHHRGGGGDVGADQQRAGGLHRHLHEDRDVAAGFGARDLGAVHRRLDLQRVLAGLDQDRIDAAGEQAAALQGQRRLQRVVGDVAEARQLGARPDAADHPAMPAVGELLRRLARQFAAALVDLERPVGDVELAPA